VQKKEEGKGFNELQYDLPMNGWQDRNLLARRLHPIAGLTLPDAKQGVDVAHPAHSMIPAAA
jgi:hypothetical protein|tara:strand:+ start:243 stop:428 length:186 start_codon:yes stop_codon:yes gene_type:complete